MDIEYLSTKEAQDLAQKAGLGPVCLETIRTWTVKFKLGTKIGGRYRITKAHFERFLKDGNKWEDERAATAKPKTW